MSPKKRREKPIIWWRLVGLLSSSLAVWFPTAMADFKRNWPTGIPVVLGVVGAFFTPRRKEPK